MTVSLVTGVGGFLGSHLAERLLDEGHRVIGVDNFLTGRRNNIKKLFHNPAFTFIHQDVSEPLKIDEKPTFIFHLASPASPVHYSWFPLETALVNSLGTKNLLDLAINYDTRFIMASTSEIYGDPLVHPQPESYWGNVNPIGPRACYDESKRFAETLSFIYHKQFGLDMTIMRIFNTYGPRMRVDDGRVISNFITQAIKNEAMTVYGDGSQTRSPCFAEDLIDGIVKVSEYNLSQGLVFNLGSDEEVTILELAESIRDIVGSHSQIVYRELPKDDPVRRKPDLSHTIEVLEWKPKVGLEEGLSKTVEWFRENLEHSKAWK